MAMKLNSKFERMNSKKLATQPSTVGGAASQRAVQDRRQGSQMASKAVLPKIGYRLPPIGSESGGGQAIPANSNLSARRAALKKKAGM